MAKKSSTFSDTLKNVIGGKPKTKPAKAAGGSRKTAEEDSMQKLTRLELLEILVDQRKEIDYLKEQLAETKERLERDDELIKKFIGRDHPELRVRREVRDE